MITKVTNNSVRAINAALISVEKEIADMRRMLTELKAAIKEHPEKGNS